MREFLKLDVLMRKISSLSKKEKKLVEIIKVIGFAFTVFKIIAVIWSLVPKAETLDGVEGEALLNAVTSSEEENKEVTETVTEAVTA